MKKLFLTSSISEVHKEVAKLIEKPKNQKLAFIYTASEAEEGDKTWLNKDREALKSIGFSTEDYTLTGKTEKDINKDLKKFQAFFLSGGNTFYLLEKIQQSNFIPFIKNKVMAGCIYISSSAGSIVAGPNIEPARMADSPQKAPNLKSTKGINLVDFVILPHWGSKHFKDIYLGSRIKTNYNTKKQNYFINRQSVCLCKRRLV